MDKIKLKQLLNDVKEQRIGIDEALTALRDWPYEDLGFAKIDTHRDLRAGFPEVIFCKGKTPQQISAIAARLSQKHDFIMATKADREAFAAIQKTAPSAVYHETAKIVLVGKPREKASDQTILVVTAGTSDLPVAEEAVVTADTMGNIVETVYDIGVAGVHRLLDHKDKLLNASIIIVVAGMEGALASVVGGLVTAPVIAVPTSVGYGASFEGLSALLSMLNCCAPGVLVVNIDNGFGAGYCASMINKMGANL